jgi:hypothetical protein
LNPPPDRPLSEASLRVLRRIADEMCAGYTGRIEIDMRDGGVAGYREIRSIHPSQMESGEGRVVAAHRPPGASAP